MDTIFYAFSVVVFAAAILAAEGAWLWWANAHGRGAQKLRRRLRIMSSIAAAGGERVSILKQRRYAKGDELDAWLRMLPLTAAIDRALLQSGRPWMVAHFLGVTLCALSVGMALVLAWSIPALPAFAIILACGGFPYWMVVRARIKRLSTIELQLPDTADFIARALRSGHSFGNVLQMVGTEMPEPLAGEFRLAHEEINYGVPINDALHSLALRVPLPDLRYLVIAVLIQRESGGNLAEILGNIARIIRARLKLLAHVRVLTAEGRMSAWILGLLPVGVIFLMSFTSRKYISLLWTDPSGQRLLMYGAIMLLIGAAWLRRLIRIRV